MKKEHHNFCIKPAVKLLIVHYSGFLYLIYNFVIFGSEIDPGFVKKKYIYHLQRIADFSSFKNIVNEILKNLECDEMFLESIMV